ncbi:N-carbamoyl-L-amino acid hydrolase [Halalkalibacter wakoensis JCM 9140]|uniref:N-carbamoyl-L-amino acid hydrolase n=1 Tax=Halalkalibacter wakoensis JCM 9140 TaxID=1236970 RepID=W4Q7B4_9BACI|nr:Zn-dependent hydrolase [Halalkalibacter wakoensis]GAE27583.1 N-carbamoyl-L-amino acid hydrolase [Halalkalibacter wakoensis JCM 9140]
MQSLRVNMTRLKSNLREVNELANAGSEGYTRLAFSQEEKMALHWLKQKLIDLNVDVECDSVGNVFGRAGTKKESVVGFGSHLDTVKNGGFLDGSLGVVVGLECLQSILENGGGHLPLGLICFIAEEANVLGGTFGSRAVAGQILFTEEFDSKLKSLHFTKERITSAQAAPKRWKSFLELHIEQGTILEKNHNQVGIVTAIAGIMRLHVSVKGRASHSGTTPMEVRQDALVDAASLILEVNRIAKERGKKFVATVGKLTVYPNSANVVPGQVELIIEARSGDWIDLQRFEKEIRSFVEEQLQAVVTVEVEKKPSQLSAFVQNSIEESCKALALPYQRIVSGANHDANSLTKVTNVGMIFVPSINGISHHPEECTNWDDIEAGANVMLQTILLLASK